MPALKIATSATDSACRASRCQSVSALCVCASALCVCVLWSGCVCSCLVVCALLCVQKFCKLAVLGRLKTICHFVLSRRVFGCFRCFWLASGLRVAVEVEVGRGESPNRMLPYSFISIFPPWLFAVES